MNNDEPIEWTEYCRQTPVSLEIISQPLISTRPYISGYTTRLEFFGAYESGQTYLPNMIPNPSAFLIQSVLISGISTALMYGKCGLIVANKYYLQMPAYLFSLREKGFKFRKGGIMLSPLIHFRFSIEWDSAKNLGNDLGGDYIDARNIQVIFYGQLLRPIQ